MIVFKEDLESIVNQHTSEPYLPDRKEELLEEWELDGITPTETDLQNHLKQNVAENKKPKIKAKEIGTATASRLEAASRCSKDPP